MLNFRKVSADCKGKRLVSYYTRDKPEQTESHGIDTAGRQLESGDRLAAYYTGRNERASWRPDMPCAIAGALGIDPRQAPKNDELARLFEAKRADSGTAWSSNKREISGFDFVFSPEKSVSLAAAFANTPAETAAIRNAIFAASEAALHYAAEDLGMARKGHAGKGAAEPGDVGWVTFCHDAARPTLPVQDGCGGPTYLIEAPVAGDPHYHTHNFLMNMVVTENGRIGSIDARPLTAARILEYGAYFQAQLAGRLRALGVHVGYDAEEQAVVLPEIPPEAIETFSKRDRQIAGDAVAYARDRNLEWNNLDADLKKKILHEASAAGKLGKTKDEEPEVWRAQAAAIKWNHTSVINKIAHVPLTDAERFDLAYRRAARHLAKEFKHAADIDYGKLRVHAARGLIGTGISGGRDDIDQVVRIIEERGIEIDGVHSSLIKGMKEIKEMKNGKEITKTKMRVTHTEQIRIEQTFSKEASRAAQDKSGALEVRAIQIAVQTIQQDDPNIVFTEEQMAAIYAMGQGSKLTLLTGVAGSGKTTLLTPLVSAWNATGGTVIGMSTAWRQADALKDAGIEATWALQPLLRAIESGEFLPTQKTVLVIDELSQIGPRPMLKLMELQAQTGMAIKMLGDREQCQAIEAGDTIELLRRVLPKSALPEILTAVRQKDPRDRKIASLFREGKAAEAFEMKREDGTAKLLEGDYDQVVAQIADFYIERNDCLRAAGKNLGMTVTALTNAEAADISQAIRARLKERGQISQDETIYKAVYYRGDKAELFDLPIAIGDKLRLYSRTWATIDGKGGSIGNNGDIVDVAGKTANGLLLRDQHGRLGEVEWRRLVDRATGRLHLGFGRAFTVAAAQGMSTKGEHANTFVHGTAGSNAFTNYPGESRATGKTYTLISKAAVLADIVHGRALGDATPITDDDLWDRIAEDTSAKPYKSLGIDLLKAARRHTASAIEATLRGHHHIEKAKLSTPDLGHEIRAVFDAAALHEAFARHRAAIENIIQQCAHILKNAAGLVADRLNSNQFALKTSDALTASTGAHTAQASPPLPPAAKAMEDLDPDQPKFPPSSPTPGM